MSFLSFIFCLFQTNRSNYDTPEQNNLGFPIDTVFIHVLLSTWTPNKCDLIWMGEEELESCVKIHISGVKIILISHILTLSVTANGHSADIFSNTQEEAQKQEAQYHFSPIDCLECFWHIYFRTFVHQITFTAVETLNRVFKVRGKGSVGIISVKAAVLIASPLQTLWMYSSEFDRCQCGKTSLLPWKQCSVVLHCVL